MNQPWLSDSGFGALVGVLKQWLLPQSLCRATIERGGRPWVSFVPSYSYRPLVQFFFDPKSQIII